MTTKTHLDQLQGEIAKTLEKISSREKYVNSQLEPQLNQYRGLSQVLAQSKEQYKQVSFSSSSHTYSPSSYPSSPTPGERRSHREVSPPRPDDR